MRLIQALLAACYLCAGGAHAISFSERSIQSPYPLIQAPIAADLVPGAGHEILLFGQQGEQRHLLVYQWQDDNFTLLVDLPLARHYFSYDLTEYRSGTTQQLFFLAATQLDLLDITQASTAKLKPIAQVQTLIQETNPAFIFRDKLLHSPGEGLAPIALVAGFSELQLISHPGQPQQRLQRLPITPNIILDNRGARYSPANLFLADINQDKRADLIWPREGHLSVFAQTPSGHFSEAQGLPIPPDINGTDWWYTRDRNGEGLDQSDLVYRKLENIADVNHDGVADLVVRFTTSQGVLERVNDYEFYFGSAGDGGIRFADSPSTTIRADGTLTDLNLVDVDGDQRAEVMLNGFNIGLPQIISALLSGSVDQQVYVFALDDRDQFGHKPRTKAEVQLKFSLSSGRSGSAVTLLADVNGDQRQDLVLSKSNKTLHIHLGEASDTLFAARPIKRKARLPEDGSQVRAADFDQDGRTDLLLSYGKLDDAGLSETLMVLIARD
jgi:hypothetical protein